MRNEALRGALFATAILISVSASTEALSRSLCLSDNELRIVLVDIVDRSLGATIATCTRKYPALATQAINTANLFASKYKSEMADNERLASEIFVRRGDGARQQEEIYKAQETAAITKVESFSLEQCRSSVLGIQLMADASDFATVRAAAQVTFASDRQRVPQCPQ